MSGAGGSVAASRRVVSLQSADHMRPSRGESTRRTRIVRPVMHDTTSAKGKSWPSKQATAPSQSVHRPTWASSRAIDGQQHDAARGCVSTPPPTRPALTVVTHARVVCDILARRVVVRVAVAAEPGWGVGRLVAAGG